MNHPPQHAAARADSGATYSTTRHWPRFQVRLAVVINTERKTSGVWIPGLVGEISRRGMALYAGIRSQPGELIYVDFRTTNHLQVSAVVRNCSGYCLGLEFLSVETGDRHAALLEAFLERHDRYLQTMQTETDRARQRIRKIRQVREELETRLRTWLKSQPCARSS